MREIACCQAWEDHLNEQPSHSQTETAPRGSVVAERLRALSSNSGVSDQQSVGSNP